MIDPTRWQAINQELAAKTIGECAYEECLEPRNLGGGRYELRLASGVHYRFTARETPWTWLRVDPASLLRDGQPVDSAVQLLIDAQQELAMNDITLGVLTQEIQNTLYSEHVRRSRLEGYPAHKWIELPGPRLQALLDGHPKLLANKGRIGWGERDLSRYAPEADHAFQLRYVAVRRARCALSLRPGVTPGTLLDESVSPEERAVLDERMRVAGVGLDTHVIVPVHPWQWQQYVVTQYTEFLASGDLVDLGVLGDTFLPQQSIRTLSNVTRPRRDDVKLALTLLNTSCYRGIPGEHLAAGVDVSGWLKGVVVSDAALRERGLLVLGENAGVHCPHPRQAQIAGTPYRYNEMLGAVWRESVEAHLGRNEQALLTSTFMQTDASGRALIAEYVERSGIPPEAWLRDLFDVTVVPLYHLMCRYGVGLVAHGQNVGVILRKGRPVRGVIKDFHGDLRLVDEDFPELAGLGPAAVSALKRLPPEHLLHDLVTGHFVTTLRFVSPLVEEQLGLPETRFYGILAETLREYMTNHPEMEARHRMFPLFTEKLLKVCVNRVRFRIGYEDSAERPLPELGTPIPNPLLPGGAE